MTYNVLSGTLNPTQSINQSVSGDRSFSIAGPWLWTSLPEDAHQSASTLTIFHRQLLKH